MRKNRHRSPGQSAWGTASRHQGAAVRWWISAGVLVLFAVGYLGQLDVEASLGCLVFAACCVYRARERSRMARPFELGGEAEARVGALLAEVWNWGWSVEHDVLKHGRGNIDHVVLTDSMIFTIDTKRSTWRERDLDQAHRHAEWAAAHYRGRRSIVPVICIQRSNKLAEEIGGVVVVGGGRLIEFLDSQRWSSYNDAIYDVPYTEPASHVWTDSLAPRAIDAEDLPDPYDTYIERVLSP